ncbi:MoaD/ThiS family protein [Cellulophaga baltica]|uniref:MoaD/ThiS family protein n=1 Tax=Cellulophaga baltica TaxID=76594 RepID=UPI000423688E|nr:MoaD/ThiS family protein [Cellulophaga baltica]WFO17537.1 MoaD/ThiS family protein [Cellulophaga baltica 4]
MKVLLFGIAKDIIGASEFEVPAQPKHPSTVKELKDVLVVLFPEFGTLSSLAIAINSEYAEENALLYSTDEIAIIPPVSGG